MKDTKRALRRHQKYTKLLNRLNRLTYDRHIHKGVYLTKGEQIQKALNGELFKKYRTTNTPCSCSTCAYLKYNRREQNPAKPIQYYLNEIK